MLGWLRNVFAPAPQPAPAPNRASVLANAYAHRLAARYEAAEQRDDLWNLANGASADAVLDPAKRQRLRNRARYEFINNPICARIVTVFADDICGDCGPVLQVESGDTATNATIEREWRKWWRQARMLERLHTAVLAYAIDGEAFAKRGNVEFTGPESMLDPLVSLRVVNFESDRVGTPWDAFERSNYADGVLFDPMTGEPIAYDVSRWHPGSNAIERSFMDFDRFSSRVILHAFRKSRVEQHRGVTPLAPALTTAGEHRKFLTATRRAAEHAATFSAIMRNITPPDLDAEAVVAEDEYYESISLPNAAGNMLFMPDNQTIEQFKAEHPNTNFEAFHEIMVSLMAGCFSMPLNRALGFTRSSGYAGNRADLLPYTRRLTADRQQMWEPLWLTPIYESWLQEFLLSPLSEGVTTEGTDVLNHRWDWSVNDLIVDPSRDETAREKRMSMGLTSRAEEITVGDLDEHDSKAAASFGMSLEDYRAAIARKVFGSAPQEQPEMTDDEEDDDDESPPDGAEVREQQGVPA